MNNFIAKNLLEIRQKKQISRRDLSIKAHVAYNVIWQLETWQKVNPKLQTLLDLANALVVKLVDFFKE